MNTLAGTYTPLGPATMEGLRLPSFDKNRIIDDHEFLVFDADCRYDVIIGIDFLTKVGMDLNYKELIIEWVGNAIPMESLHRPNALAAHVDSYLMQIKTMILTLKTVIKHSPF